MKLNTAKLLILFTGKWAVMALISTLCNNFVSRCSVALCQGFRVPLHNVAEYILWPLLTGLKPVWRRVRIPQP
jgi:hypothetical protein